MQVKLGELANKLDGQIKGMIDLYKNESDKMDRVAETYDVLYFIAGDLINDMLSRESTQSLEERSVSPEFLSGESDFEILRNPIYTIPLGIPGIDIGTPIRWGADGYNPNFLGANPVSNLQVTEVPEGGGSTPTADPAPLGEAPPVPEDADYESIEGGRQIIAPVPPNKQGN